MSVVAKTLKARFWIQLGHSEPMWKNRRALQGILAVAVLSGFAWLALRPPREPVYEGKPLGYWLRHPMLTPITNYPFLGGTSINFPKVDSNAVPFLVQALERPDGAFDRQYGNLYLKLPPRFRSRLPKPVFPGELRTHATSILCKMGKDAKPAIPVLIRMMKTDSSSNARFGATTCLLSIGGGDETVKEAFEEVLKDKFASEGVRLMMHGYRQPASPKATGSAGVTNSEFDFLFLDIR